MESRKITEGRESETNPGPGVQHGRWYDDACGTAFALELVGERWALLVVRELLLGGRRFSDLRAGLPGISARVLTERLEGLERAGIVRRRQTPPPAPVQLYELTAWGMALEPTILMLGSWAAASPHHDATLPLSPVGFMLSLRAMFRGDWKGREQGDVIRVNFVIAGQDFRATLADGLLSVARGHHDTADVTLTAPAASPLAALVHGKAPPRTLADAGLVVEGGGIALFRFVSAFDLPRKAEA